MVPGILLGSTWWISGFQNPLEAFYILLAIYSLSSPKSPTQPKSFPLCLLSTQAHWQPRDAWPRQAPHSVSSRSETWASSALLSLGHADSSGEPALPPVPPTEVNSSDNTSFCRPILSFLKVGNLVGKQHSVAQRILCPALLPLD